MQKRKEDMLFLCNCQNLAIIFVGRRATWQWQFQTLKVTLSWHKTCRSGNMTDQCSYLLLQLQNCLLYLMKFLTRGTACPWFRHVFRFLRKSSWKKAVSNTNIKIQGKEVHKVIAKATGVWEVVAFPQTVKRRGILTIINALTVSCYVRLKNFSGTALSSFLRQLFSVNSHRSIYFFNTWKSLHPFFYLCI